MDKGCSKELGSKGLCVDFSKEVDFGHLASSSAVVTLLSGISQGRRNLELDMKPGWAPRPEEWE